MCEEMPLERSEEMPVCSSILRNISFEDAVKMPLRCFLPWLLCFTMDLAFGATGYVRHVQCTLSQRTALCSGSKLSSVPVDLPGSTEELQLNNNSIKQLKNSCLVGYPHLRVLSLVSNGMEVIETEVFVHSRHVENLSLADNSLYLAYQQTGEALSALSQLKVLDLSGNGLAEDMVPFLLQNMTSLEYLSLSRNILLRLDQTIFHHLYQLKELNLERNQLFEIEEGAFDNLQKLQRLNMAFNNLPCLVGFQLTKLVVLNASHNAIEWFISNQDVEDTFHLETLDLRDNKLIFFPFLPSRSYLQNLLLSGNKVSFYQHLAYNSSSNWTTTVQFYNLNSNMSTVTASLWDESLHGDMSSLDLLDLSVNQVTYLPHGFFSQMPNLSRLKLGTNCLETFSLTSEGMSSSLYELDVSNNKLTVLQVNQSSLDMLGNLEHLNLSLNNLQKLPRRLFASLPNLSVVDLSRNKVAICSLEEQSAGTEYSDCVVLRNISSLRQLYLRDCSLGQLPSMAFEGTPLTHLELSGNTGVIIKEDSMTGISQTLKYLGLGGIHSLNVDFSQFVCLHSLDISANSLSLLPDSLLRLSLRWLDLHDNHLQTIPVSQAQILSYSINTLFLGGNPFNCCQLDWLRTFEEANTVIIEDLASLTCFTDLGREQRLSIRGLDMCGGVDEESSWWYVLLLLPAFLSLLGVAIIFFVTFRPNQLPREIKRRCWRPTPY
ncbi:transforming growth factor beta activator LRRC33-like isoform X2 [Scleropages formosus]|uniref:transforming growth factor beta activator LRRC33-like isoform X2 n=1 Tax=Scleropages formosus TaxID=113540 RepID=UPI0008791D65|nr:transforming growth factor beta activator LRRC33-like isoform X2 [Scleropages formosus]